MTAAAFDAPTELDPATERMPAIALRPACASDCERVYEWNFAPDVRAHSLLPDLVAFEEHARWFARRIDDLDSPIWIIEEHFQPVGVVRIDMIGGVGRVSIALAPEARGRHLGRQAITAACAGCPYELFAEIAAENHASRRCFEACRFRALAEHEHVVFYQRTKDG